MHNKYRQDNTFTHTRNSMNFEKSYHSPRTLVSLQRRLICMAMEREFCHFHAITFKYATISTHHYSIITHSLSSLMSKSTILLIRPPPSCQKLTVRAEKQSWHLITRTCLAWNPMSPGLGTSLPRKMVQVSWILFYCFWISMALANVKIGV